MTWPLNTQDANPIKHPQDELEQVLPTEGPTTQLTGPKKSAANVPEADTTGHTQGPCFQALMGQSYSGRMRGRYTILSGFNVVVGRCKCYINCR